MNNIASEVLAAYKSRFSSNPRLYYSPGRINLIGEHIDYNSGYVMPAAISKGIYYAVAANNTNNINFYSVDFNEAFSTTINNFSKSEGWKNYLLSVLKEFELLSKSIGGFDCVFGGDIPVGSGMSSSAAVEGGLAFAVNDIFNLQLNRKALALLCQRAEHNYPNVKCGIMDMYASLNGKQNHVILLDCETVTHEYFPFDFEDYQIVLINSKVQHSLASGEYNLRRKNCETGISILKQEPGVLTFRDIKSTAVVDNIKMNCQAKFDNCCRYVVEEIKRTQQAGLLLKQHNVEAFGKLMFETHEGLSKLYKVSCPELDFLVEKARQNKMIAGARLMGGGFGGCTINIIHKRFCTGIHHSNMYSLPTAI
ncbi:MAG: galactokinase [Bacteroidia bacterium]|nr:galactokinase [Bacteroidia bacterium]